VRRLKPTTNPLSDFTGMGPAEPAASPPNDEPFDALGIGIIPGLPDPDYRSDPAVGHSDIRHWLHPKRLGREAALIGHATHTLVIEGRVALEERFVSADCDFDLRTCEGKERMAELVGDSGKELLRHKERALVERLAAAVWGHDEAKKILQAKGEQELTVIGKFPGFEQLYKCRIDLQRRASIWDLKTTSYVNEEQFRDAEVDYGYINQLEWYGSLYAAVAGKWLLPGSICVSKREPHNVWIRYPHEIPNQLMAMARKWRVDVLTLYERYVPPEMREAARKHGQRKGTL
jgi:hypothetical protein